MKRQLTLDLAYLLCLVAGSSFFVGCSSPPPIVTKTVVDPKMYPPKPSVLAYNEGMRQRRAGNEAGYVENLEKAGKLDPEDVLVAYARAELYYSKGNGQKALPLYRQIVDETDRVYSTTETDPTVLTHWGEVELEVGSAENAETAFHRAVAELPRWDKAKRRPTPTFPNTKPGLRAQAHVVAMLKNYFNGNDEGALKHLAFISQLFPKNYETKYWQGFLLESLMPPKAPEALAIYRDIVAHGSGRVVTLAAKDKHRLEYYWKVRHTWDPFDPKTQKRMTFNPKTRKYEIADENTGK